MLLLAIQVKAFNGKYPILNFTPTDYKAGIQNIDFAQNRDMNIFVANNLGVLSYNANEWTLHNFETGKKNRSLAFDEESDRLYVGSQGDFGFFEDNWEYTSLLDKIPTSEQDFDDVWDVFLFNDKVYFCTFKSIYEFDGEHIKIIKNKDGFDRSFVSGGKLFTQDRLGNVFEIIDGELKLKYANQKQGQVIRGMIPKDGSHLLFYNSGEISFPISPGDLSEYSSLAKALENQYVNHVLELSDSRLVIATQTSGLFLYDLEEKSTENITKEDGLLASACLRVFQDYSGNLWIGMQNGIALIDINSPSRLVNQDVDVEGSGYEAYETDRGTYFSTSNGIYFLSKGSNKSTFLSGTEGPAYGIQNIGDRLYAGHHTGLFLLRGSRAERVAVTDGLWKLHILESNSNYVLGGTYSGLVLFRINDKGLEFVSKIKGFDESSRFFEEDRHGNIWVSQYYKGLYKLSLSESMLEASVDRVSDQSDIPIQEQVILSKIDDDIYLGTQKGIYLLSQNEDKFTQSTIFSKAIGEQAIYLIQQDKNKNVHIVSKDMVGFFRQRSNNNYTFSPSSINRLQYYLNNDLLTLSTETSSGVYYSANEGFIHYDPDLEHLVETETPLIVDRLFSVTQNKILYHQKPFGERPDLIDEIVVDRGSKVLKIDVESFQFNDAGNQAVSYYLKGFDDDFGDPTSITTKEYSNLKEGHYEFHVKTENFSGDEISGQTLKLKVKPPLYRSLFAKVLYILLGLLSLIAVAMIQKRRYKKKATMVEEARQLELEKEQQKLRQIEEQSEKELQNLQAEKMENELSHLNNLLAASTMNLVVKNDFIGNIRHELKDVKLKGENPDTKRAMEKIVKEIDTTLRVQEDWKQFEHHFDQVHGDFLNRLRNEFSDLTPSEQKLSVFLRLNLNTKDIANLLSISVRGVEVARYRLRKKLNLAKGVNLSKFVLEY